MTYPILGLGLPWLTFPRGQYLSYLDLAIPYVDIPSAWVPHQASLTTCLEMPAQGGSRSYTLTIPLILRTSGSLSIHLELPFEVISLVCT